ncbi:MCE family protein [Nocardia sp. alder85J]|uniref:MCE family protein n=1 Tax=Nocardia sp. alder85J TaxID=2862949 RepID=UPI001CD4BA18|nr:MCE family protein [Nocardia sp. alder85J]MCX4091760.1 MCE family protein [Nocardia sp. alder85J]
MTARRCASAALVLLTAAAAGCAVSVDRLPAPGPAGGTYTVTATFANALNLPTKAKVKLEGADVGEVTTMTAKDYTAVVTMRIGSGVLLPVGTTAELRSATPLGDVFVAVTPPEHPDPGAGVLHDGANIPLAATTAASTIEEVLARAALLVNGGTIENVTRVLNALGEDVGGRGDKLEALITRTRDLLDGLAARSDRIRAVVAAAAQLGATVAQQQPSLDAALAAAGPASAALADNTRGLIDLVDRLAAIATQLSRFPSVQGTNDRSLMAEVNQLAGELDDAAESPQVNLDSLNSIIAPILKILDGSSAHADIDVAQVAIGPVPDPNFPGDPGARPPDQTDWVNFVGSLEYNLGRLHDRIAGPGR